MGDRIPKRWLTGVLNLETGRTAIPAIPANFKISIFQELTIISILLLSTSTDGGHLTMMVILETILGMEWTDTLKIHLVN